MASPKTKTEAKKQEPQKKDPANYTSVYLNAETRAELAELAKAVPNGSRSRVISNLIHQASQDDTRARIAQLVNELSTLV